jgi:hypothetical protein
LLEITMAARSARHAGLLDGYEEEADELLALALAPDSVDALGINRIGALSVALNQVRHAIAERRQSFAVPIRAQFSPRIVHD